MITELILNVSDVGSGLAINRVWVNILMFFDTHLVLLYSNQWNTNALLVCEALESEYVFRFVAPPMIHMGYIFGMVLLGSCSDECFIACVLSVG